METDIDMFERNPTIFWPLCGKSLKRLNEAVSSQRHRQANELNFDRDVIFVRYISRHPSNIAATHSDLSPHIMPPHIERVTRKQCTPMLKDATTVQALSRPARSNSHLGQDTV